MMSWLRRLLRLRTRALQPLGTRGEKYAAKWLKQRGYRVLERNRSIGDDEADLVVLDPDGVTVAIVEVKTRREAHPAPEASVGPTKQFRLARAAARLQNSARYRGRPFRFDVIAIIWPDGEAPHVQHWPNAFESPF